MLLLLLLLLMEVVLLFARLRRRRFFSLSLSVELVSLVEEEGEGGFEEHASSSRAIRNWRPTLERGFTRVRPVSTDEEDSLLAGNM